MSVMGFNAGAEMASLRTQQTLAMQASAPAAAPAAVAAAAPVAAAGDPAAAAGGVPAAAGDAAAAAMAVQPPPSTSKIVLGSVLKGALSGASMSMGLKSMAPMLSRIPFFANIIGAAAKDGKAATGLIALMGRIPLLRSALPLMGKAGPLGGFLVTALVGATVGAIFGALKGVRTAKKAAADYAEALAAQQAAQAQQPTPAETPVDPTTANVKPKYKSWVVARQGSHKGAAAFGHYTTGKGDTLKLLAQRFHTTEAEIRRLNPKLGETVEPGVKLKLKRKVVPDAKAWRQPKAS